MSRIDAVRDLADPLVTARGFRIYDVDEHGPAIRVTVTGSDRASAPGIDDISSMSRELSRALDEADPISGSYTLEVSTPGLERRLRTPEHFQTATGETVSVKIRRSGEAAYRLRGVLVAANDTEVTVRVEPEEKGGESTDQQVSYDIIDTARTVFEWGMTPPETPEGGTDSTGATRRSDS